MLIKNISISVWDEYQTSIYIIDGQNLTQIIEYKQLNNTNQWNPCIPMPFEKDTIINITFVDNGYNNFRDWYPSQICDYPYNFVNYKNKYLFHRKNDAAGFFYEGTSLNIHHLSIHDYIINDNKNYPIVGNTGTSRISVELTLHYGSFINISSVTTEALFYAAAGTALKKCFNDCLFSNISAKIIFYNNVKHFFFHMRRIFLVMRDSYCGLYFNVQI